MMSEEAIREMARDWANQRDGWAKANQRIAVLEDELKDERKRRRNALDKEQARWQEAIRNLCIERTAGDIDGVGCDSGDPLDVTLAEISQALESARGAEKSCHEKRMLKELDERERGEKHEQNIA